MKINKTKKIACSPEELWTWLTEFEKLKIWNKSLLEEEFVSSGEVKAGFKSKVLILEGKKEVWYENELLEYAPYEHLSISLKGGSLGKSPMIVDYHIEKQENELVLSYHSSWQAVGLILKILHPMISIAANKNAEACLSALKHHIEKDD